MILTDIIVHDDLYSGVYGRASINLYAFNSNGNRGIEEVCQQMARTPKWAKCLILRADGYECEFYKKD